MFWSSPHILQSVLRYFLVVYYSLPSLRGIGGSGDVLPLTAACAPHFALLKILCLEHHSMPRHQTMIEKGIITFKHNFPLKFIDSLQNCWQSTALHKSEAIIRLINTP